jgi:hypothetical protein
VAQQEDRVAKLNRLAELEAEEATLASQIAVHKENDPAILKVLEAKRVVAKQAADRWTGTAALVPMMAHDRLYVWDVRFWVLCRQHLDPPFLCHTRNGR